MPLAHKSTISTFRIQLSGQSVAAIAFIGSSNRSPWSSSCFFLGTLLRSMPKSDGAVHRLAPFVTPTQSIRVSFSFPGYSLSPLPTIWAYRLSDWVGRAMMTVSTRGMSVPSVNTITLTRHGISRFVNLRMISARFSVLPVTTTAPGIRFAISSAWWILTAKTRVAPTACF